MHASPRCLQTPDFCDWDLGGTSANVIRSPAPPLPGRCRAAVPPSCGSGAARVRGRGRGWWRGAAAAGPSRPGKGSSVRGARTTPAVAWRKAASARRGLQKPRQGWREPAATCSAPWRCGSMRGANALQRVLISFRSFCSSRRGRPLPPPPPSPRHAGTAPLRRAEFGVNLHLAALE